MPFSSRFPTIIPIIIINPLNSKEMNNKKKNEGRTDFSYYGLYLLDYLTTNKFEQAADEPSSEKEPTVPPKRMNGQGSKAILPTGRRNWR